MDTCEVCRTERFPIRKFQRSSSSGGTIEIHLCEFCAVSRGVVWNFKEVTDLKTLKNSNNVSFNPGNKTVMSKLEETLLRQVGDTRKCPHCKNDFVPDDPTSHQALKIYHTLFGE